MDWETARTPRRLRARPEAGWSPTGETVFRIEDQSGRLLDRVRGARHAQEALALHWRRLGRGLAGATGHSDLDRSIDLARKRQNPTQSLPQLPLPAGEARDDEQPTAPRARVRQGGGQHGAERAHQPRPEAAATPQQDLFGPDEAADEPAAVEPATVEARADEPPVEETSTNPEPLDPAFDETVGQSVPDPDVAAAALLALAREPEVQLLDPASIMLQRVDIRQFNDRDRADGYLYHVTTGQDAQTALGQGLAVNPLDPVILTERPGVTYWMSVLAEDFDVILDGPADLVVLRMRRHAVQDWLEPDPHASRSAGCACFLLTGARRG